MYRGVAKNAPVFDSTIHFDKTILKTSQRRKKPKMKKSFIGKIFVIAALVCVAAVAVLTFSACSSTHTHSYTNMSVLQVATCNEVGVLCAACDCGDTQIREMPKTAHTEGEWRPLYEATCITKGSQQLFCSVCGEVMKIEQVPALGHDLVSYEKREPTCALEGHEAYEACSRCSHTTYKAISKTAHTVDPDSKYPTCTEPLLCSYCDSVVKPATGHMEIVTTGVPATCLKEGKTDYIECFACKLVIQESIKIPKRAHNIEVLPAVAPTCFSIGQTMGQRCKDCGEYTVYPTNISKVAHKYSSATDTTCDGEFTVKIVDAATGAVTTETKKCTYERAVVVGSKCKHSTRETRYKIAVTCTQFGVTSGEECLNCNEVLTPQSVIGKDGKTITNIADQTLSNLPAHSLETIKGYAATPTKPGLTDGQRCTVCKLIVKQQDIIPPLSKTAND